MVGDMKSGSNGRSSQSNRARRWSGSSHAPRVLRQLARGLIVLAVGLAALPALPASPAGAATTTYAPTDDATVKEGELNSRGSNPSLEVDASSRKDILIRFDVGSLDTSAVTTATLRLFNIDSSSYGGDVFAVSDTNWSELDVIWDTAPPADAGLLGSIATSVSVGQWYEVDVTPLVLGDAEGVVSVRISSPNSNGADYASTESANGNAPELVVVTDSPPVPDDENPTAPTNLAASSVFASSVSLTWDPSTDNIGVVAYDIVRDGSPLASIGGTQTTYQDTSVAPETAYTYTVFARDAAGNVSPSSNALVVTTPVFSPPTFLVTRDAGTSIYRAVSQTSSYAGSLKSVVESAAAELTGLGGGIVSFTADDFDLGSEHFELDSVNDVIFEGQGIDMTIIRNFTNASSDTEPFDAVRSDRLTIRDLTVSAGGSDRTTSDALDFDGGDDIVIERVKVSDSRGRGIVFDGKDDPAVTGGTADRNIIRNCVVANTPRDGIQLLAANDNRIENCQISNSGAEGIRVHRGSSSAGQPLKPSNDNVITGNTIVSASGNGISVNSGSRNEISSNTITGSSSHGIRIHRNPSSLICNDNVIDLNSATSNGGYGLEISDADCNRTVVGDNDFTGNGSGEINDSGTNTIYTSTDTEAPTVPSNLTTTAVAPANVDLAWDPSTDNVAVVAYDVRRDSTVIASISGATTTYSDTSVSPDTAYQYSVTARDAAGNVSGLSNLLDVTTPPDTTAPTAPANLMLTDVSATSVSLQWDPSIDDGAVTEYEIRRDGTPIDTVAAPSTTWTDTTVTPDTAYSYVVHASDGAGNLSDASNTVNVTTPVQPSILTLIPSADATIKEGSSQPRGTTIRLEVDLSSRKDLLLRYDVSGIGTASIVSATLRLYNIDKSSHGGDFFAMSDTNWSETSVIWDNAPPADGALLGSLPGGVDANTWYEIDVTSLVTGDGPVSIRGSSPSTNGADYASREHPGGNAPELVIVLAP